MTKREQYGLEFSKVNVQGLFDSYLCTTTENSIGSLPLSNLLFSLGKLESPFLLHEVENAMNNLPYEEYYSCDNATFGDGVQIIPPTAIVNQVYTIGLGELRAILEEWISFTNL